MTSLAENLPTLLLLLPLAGAILVMLCPTRESVRWVALAATLLTFGFSLLLFVFFNWSKGTSYAYLRGAGGVVQLVREVDWIPAFHIKYKVGIDGLSLPMVVLTTFICPLACIASWNVTKMTKGYMALFLFLETGILGVFLSLDLFLFYVFFEVSLLPMYFLIGIWGGPRKEYAAIKFFLYTLVGSIFLLIAVIGIYLYSRQVFPGGTFDLIQLAGPEMRAKFAHGAGLFGAAKVFFILLMVGFLVKAPAVPFHTWLPDAHVEAPTAMSMILAALLLKMGGYGILRVAYPLFPDAAKALWLLVGIVGVVSIVYGALCAMAQTDFKRLVAYSSVSHMGFVTLGAAMMTPASINGAIFMMVAHGVTSAMLFFIVGVVYDRAHHRELSRMGGLATTMPVYAGFSALACFANLGLPGLCGFIGEIMVLLGTFQAARGDSILMTTPFANAGRGAVYTLGALACVGIVLTAAYMLWTLQRIFFGPERNEYRGLPEVNRREVAVLTPLAIMAILLGVLPAVFVFNITGKTVAGLHNLLGGENPPVTAAADR